MDDFTPHPKHANFDLVSAVVAKARKLPISVTGVHIKGHQDDRANHQFTRLERLNVAMDKLAKAYWIHVVTNHNGPVPLPPHITIEDEGWQIYNGATKIVHPKVYTIYDTIYTPKLQHWWRRKQLVKQSITPFVDWDCVADTMRKLRHNQ